MKPKIQYPAKEARYFTKVCEFKTLEKVLNENDTSDCKLISIETSKSQIYQGTIWYYLVYERTNR